MKPYLVLMLCLLLGSCNRYVVTFNERQVYEPAEPFSDFSLTDEALETCIRQTIKDQKLTKAGQLHTLNCSQAGITTLQGIELFSALRNLNLSGNQLTGINPLLLLNHLERVNLADNPGLECPTVLQLTRQTRVRVRLPKQCAG